MSYNTLLRKFEKLNVEAKEDLCEKVKDWALMHAIAMRPRKNLAKSKLTMAPFSLLPSPIPKDSFEKALAVQTVLNKLLHCLAYDSQFLQEALSKVIEYDDFTRRLFEIYTAIRKEGLSQLTVAIIRNDLMFAGSDYKQVEVNTIAAGFGFLGPATTALHRFVLNEMNLDGHVGNLPENDALTSICNGIIQAWKMFNVESSVILFLVEDVTYNICDQRYMEFEINRLDDKIKVIRRSFTQLTNEAYLGPGMELIVGSLQVGLIYFRCGYDPTQYTEEFWSLRLMMERSTAIKCPSIQFHLVGTKKVQQIFCQTGVLEKYLSDPENIRILREMFVDMYALDQSEEGEKGYRLAFSHPEQFVLKPQREGGSNNIYGQDIPKYLAGITREEASSWILMHLIRPNSFRNLLIWPSSDEFDDIVSELGVFGVLIGTDKEILFNNVCGHMMRTKSVNVLEGGVSAGKGVLDSPYLVFVLNEMNLDAHVGKLPENDALTSICNGIIQAWKMFNVERDSAVVTINLGGQDVILASVYMPYEEQIPSTCLERLTAFLGRQKTMGVIGMDANAHHIAWGSSNTNNRGITREEASSWVLMHLIRPNSFRNLFSWPSSDEFDDIVSELGVFGVLIGTDKEILFNNFCGHMMRTKSVNVLEGGVSAGKGVLDSPYLVCELNRHYKIKFFMF